MCDVIHPCVFHEPLSSLVRICAMTQQTKTRAEEEKCMRDELQALRLEEQVFYVYL